MDPYDRLASRCKLRFHVSIETDRDSMPGLPPHASPVERRLEACGQLRQAGQFTVVTVSPLLPIDDADRFFGQIAGVADAVVVNHFIDSLKATAHRTVGEPSSRPYPNRWRSWTRRRSVWNTANE